MSDVVQSIAKQKNRSKLARLVVTLATAVYEARGSRLGDGVLEVLAELELTPEKTAFADFQLSEVLQQDSNGEEVSPEQLAVIGALFAMGVAQLRLDDDNALELAKKVTWLGANSVVDASPWLSTYLEEGSGSRALWQALGQCAAEAVQRNRAEGMVALACLASSDDPAAAEALSGIAVDDCDRTIALLLAGLRKAQRSSRTSYSDELPTVPRLAGEELAPSALQGEVVARRLGGAGLMLQTLSGILLLRWLWRGLSVGVLRLQRRAEVRMDSKGIELRVERSILGRPLSEKHSHIPWDNLARLSRELRYPQLAAYTGLGCALIGTYIGVSFLVDGVRAASPWLIGLGLGLPLLGLLCDFLFARLLAARRGQGFLDVRARKGRGFTVRCDELDAIDTFLHQARNHR